MPIEAICNVYILIRNSKKIRVVEWLEYLQKLSTHRQKKTATNQPTKPYGVLDPTDQPNQVTQPKKKRGKV